MHFILCSGEVLRAGQVPTAPYGIFMAQSRSCRLLLRHRGVSKAEMEVIDGYIKYFVSNYYAKIYRRTAERLPLCLSTIASRLDVFPPLCARGPAWIVWQFPMERKIRALGKLIGSQSSSHANLTKNVTMPCKADLFTSFGKKNLPSEWAGKTGKPPAPAGLPAGSLLSPRASALISCCSPNGAPLPPSSGRSSPACDRY